MLLLLPLECARPHLPLETASLAVAVSEFSEFFLTIIAKMAKMAFQR